MRQRLLCSIVWNNRGEAAQMKNHGFGWILYTEGDSSLHPDYIRLYENACQKRGMSIELRWYHPKMMRDANALCTWKERLLRESPQYVINRTRDWRVAKLLEDLGIRVFNPSWTARLGNDKALAYRYMQKRGIPVMPVMYGTKQPPQWYPAVVKSCDGHGGTEVFFIRNEADWKEWKAQEISSPGQKRYLIQQAASELGKDVRVYIVGNDIVAAVLRTSETDFRSNYCLGGRVQLYELSFRERELVQRAVQELSIGMAGVDFIFHKGEPVFNEIEDMAGARGLYSLTDYDIVDAYIDHIQEELWHVTSTEKPENL